MKFEYTKEEIEKINKWIKDVKDKHDQYYFGAIGGEVEYVFIPTGLGMIKEVRFLGETFNPTNYEEW